MNKRFPAELDKLYEMLDFVRDQARAAGFNTTFVNKIELATEEVLVNIISYGYPHLHRSSQIQSTIDIQCTFAEDLGIKITIKDYGIPYNPLKTVPNYNPQDVLKKQTVGGYGIFFILSLMDEVNYQREHNLNVLTLVKKKENQEASL